MTITIEKSGRRYYIIAKGGSTYSIKSRLKSAGCKWDPDRRAWWTSKQEVAERFAGEHKTSSHTSSSCDGPTVREDQPLLGKVKYAAKSGRVGTWFAAAEANSGRILLTNLAGDRCFWAHPSRCQWVKRYDPNANRGLGTTLRSLRAFIADKESAKKAGHSDVREYRAVRSGRCRGCGGPIEDAPHHRAMGGYCGSCAFDEFDC